MTIAVRSLWMTGIGAISLPIIPTIWMRAAECPIRCPLDDWDWKKAINSSICLIFEMNGVSSAE